MNPRAVALIAILVVVVVAVVVWLVVWWLGRSSAR